MVKSQESDWFPGVSGSSSTSSSSSQTASITHSEIRPLAEPGNPVCMLLSGSGSMRSTCWVWAMCGGLCCSRVPRLPRALCLHDCVQAKRWPPCGLTAIESLMGTLMPLLLLCQNEVIVVKKNVGNARFFCILLSKYFSIALLFPVLQENRTTIRDLKYIFFLHSNS